MTHWKNYMLYLLCTTVLGAFFGVSCYNDDFVEQPSIDFCQFEDEISFDVLCPIFSLDIEGTCEVAALAPIFHPTEYADYICPGVVAGAIVSFPLRGPPAIA